jgi:hypothetical protein
MATEQPAVTQMDPRDVRWMKLRELLLRMQHGTNPAQTRNVRILVGSILDLMDRSDHETANADVVVISREQFETLTAQGLTPDADAAALHWCGHSFREHREGGCPDAECVADPCIDPSCPARHPRPTQKAHSTVYEQAPSIHVSTVCPPEFPDGSQRRLTVAGDFTVEDIDAYCLRQGLIRGEVEQDENDNWTCTVTAREA